MESLAFALLIVARVFSPEQAVAHQPFSEYGIEVLNVVVPPPEAPTFCLVTFSLKKGSESIGRLILKLPIDNAFCRVKPK